MSHHKRKPRGKSYYLDAVNPKIKKYVRACCACGKRGYDPALDDKYSTVNSYARAELARMYQPMHLNAAGVCASCSDGILDTASSF